MILLLGQSDTQNKANQLYNYCIIYNSLIYNVYIDCVDYCQFSL